MNKSLLKNLGGLGRRIANLHKHREHSAVAMDCLEARRLMTTVTFTSAPTSVAEGGSDIVLALHRDLPTSGAASYNAAFVVGGDGAHPASSGDYSLSGDISGGNVHWASGLTAAFVTVHAVDDSAIEYDEGLTFKVTDDFGTSTASMTIVDDDNPSIAVTGSDVTEGNNGTVVVHRTATGSGHDASTLTLTLVVTGDATGSTDLGTDYNALTGTGVTSLGGNSYLFTMGPSQSDQTLSYTTTNDSDVEATGTLTMTCAGQDANGDGIKAAGALGGLSRKEAIFDNDLRFEYYDPTFGMQITDRHLTTGFTDVLGVRAFNGDGQQISAPFSVSGATTGLTGSSGTLSSSAIVAFSISSSIDLGTGSSSSMSVTGWDVVQDNNIAILASAPTFGGASLLHTVTGGGITYAVTVKDWANTSVLTGAPVSFTLGDTTHFSSSGASSTTDGTGTAYITINQISSYGLGHPSFTVNCTTGSKNVTLSNDNAHMVITNVTGTGVAASTTSNLQGILKNSDGLPVSGMSILFNPDANLFSTNGTFSITTGSDGSFTIARMSGTAPAVYHIGWTADTSSGTLTLSII